MAVPDRENRPYTGQSEQGVLNESRDELFKVLAMLPVEWDGGTKIFRAQSSNVAVRFDPTNDPILYLGKAPIGTTTSDAKWQISKLDTSSGFVKTWADGDADFDNVWDNRTSLTYN